MSQTRFQNEAQRWLDTAGEDLRAARVLRTEQLFAHACFMAQQCGEKSLKAMWYAVGQEPAGQSIQKLVMQFPEPQTIPDVDMWRQHAAVLDKFFSATRYPNELPDLTPGQSYFAQDADQAIEYANGFLRAVRQAMGAPLGAVVKPGMQPTASLPPDSIEAKISLSSSGTRSAYRPLTPPTPTNVSSEEDTHHQHRRRRSHSWQSRLKRFLAQRETWVLVIMLILAAIVLGIVLPMVRVR